MARLNISVPDPLYERLDHLREQINASRVCSAALAHEVERVEGHPVPAGGQRERLIDRLVQRLRGTRELWYLRGREDAESWAADAASLDELTHVGERWPEHPSYDLEANDLPVSFQIWALVYKWELQDIWVPAGWDWLRTHLASRLRVHERQVRLGTEEGRHFMLRQLGYVQEPSGDAVRAFQKDRGLEENAYLGPAGWAALINAYIDKARLGEIDLGGSMSQADIASV